MSTSVDSAEHLLPRMLTIAAPDAETYKVSDGELEVAAEMSARGIWHINYRGRDDLYPRLLCTTDTREQAVSMCARAKRELPGRLPSDYYICLLLHNLVLSAQPADDLLPYLCYPLDQSYREQNARQAALFAQVECPTVKVKACEWTALLTDAKRIIGENS